MTNFIIRSNDWTPIPTRDLAKIYYDFSTKLNLANFNLKIEHEPANNNLTYAENFGKYVRELFFVYSAILEEMKFSREWIALQVRSIDHSKANYSDSIIIDNNNNADQIQIRGFHLDPLAFDFHWQDNSMEHPWKPWNWQLDILPDDLDEAHYFFDLKSEKAFIGGDNQISFCKMKPKFPKILTRFRISEII